MCESYIYHIFAKNHEKKESIIFVVQLDVKVSDEIFVELKRFAKDLHGYYSSFKGVNGFVFNDEDEAYKFGEKLDDYLEIVDENGNPYFPWLSEYADALLNVSKDVTNQNNEQILQSEEIPLDNFCTALRLLIEDKGAKIITDTIYKSIESLKSVDAFKGLPPSIEFILRTFIMKKYGKRLLESRNSLEDYQKMIDEFIFQTGFQRDFVESIFACVSYAVSGKENIPYSITITSIKK